MLLICSVNRCVLSGHCVLDSSALPWPDGREKTPHLHGANRVRREEGKPEGSHRWQRMPRRGLRRVGKLDGGL